MTQHEGLTRQLVRRFPLDLSMQWTIHHSRGSCPVTMKVLVLELEQHLKSASGASVVAIDNKIEQAMDLVKSHLMYAVREEVEVLKEQIKELNEKNSQLEQENSLLKTLASPEQLAQFQAQLQNGSPPSSSSSSSSSSQPATSTTAPAQPASQSSGPSA
ncbi:TSC22 domain family protein 1 isoform 2-T2 [Anomaloglossus baeobatrachus]|uniref:TSC22 domain family protein 1 isoform X2 n=1 Tax=Anomaloglossus baeobatrachus TaxID=238106 RepID=UPI003F504280